MTSKIMETVPVNICPKCGAIIRKKQCTKCSRNKKLQLLPEFVGLMENYRSLEGAGEIRDVNPITGELGKYNYALVWGKRVRPTLEGRE